ncbi:MAG: class I SAM-dependent methyltransferase [Gemmatimonadetes bacterium]|nr:class I SAM-dependent methyltransferase [Gemmatimonadota bacterium]
MSDYDFDARYAEAEWAYGTEPNDFLRASAGQIPRGGRVLCLAEGQGRNAVFLAAAGHPVTAVDRSAPGLARAQALAAERKVSIETQLVDLAEFEVGTAQWDGIVAIFAHLPPPLRRRVHQAVVAGLRPGGVFILEAYSPAQLQRTTGGPRSLDLLMSIAVLREELAGLDFLVAQEIDREVIEGKYHTGTASVVQVLALKPVG